MTLTRPTPAAPRRPWTAWLAAASYLAACGVWLTTLLVTMWESVYAFEAAALLHRLVPTALGDPLRALLAACVWAIAVALGTLAVVTGYYGWSGYGWTRWWAVALAVLSPLSFLGGTWAPLALVGVAAGGVALWLPATRRFFESSDAHRHPRRPAPEGERPPVIYGPVSRYAE